jgi:NadR type nicotinamide-nucleotide adenylyltransferase
MEKGLRKTNNNIFRVAVTGPESTGKSRLSEELALHYNTLWVPEYAREYLFGINREYTSDDILAIAKGQYKKEMDFSVSANGLLISDTDFLVLKIWHEYKYKTCPEYIEDKLRHHRYNLYLLMDIDLDWEYDPLREHPHMRKYFFDLYRNELEKHGFPYRIVRGKNEKRLNNAIAFIDEALQE